MSCTYALALITSAAGVLVALLALALARDLRAGLSMALELWMAAGLLRLSSEASAANIATAAAIIAVRTLVSSALRQRPRAQRAARP